MKASSVLSKEQAIGIFKLSLVQSPGRKRKTATSVAKEFRVSEKTIRDIWSGRTWHVETMPLDPSRSPRAAKKNGRPLGRKDSLPRKSRKSTNSTTINTTPTDREQPILNETSVQEVTLYCNMGDKRGESLQSNNIYSNFHVQTSPKDLPGTHQPIPSNSKSSDRPSATLPSFPNPLSPRPELPVPHLHLASSRSPSFVAHPYLSAPPATLAAALLAMHPTAAASILLAACAAQRAVGRPLIHTMPCDPVSPADWDLPFAAPPPPPPPPQPAAIFAPPSSLPVALGLPQWAWRPASGVQGVVRCDERLL